MKDVFISYTKNDKSTAYSLVSYLENKGVKCFIAPRDVEPGKAYASILMDALEECKIVLLIASKSINDSEHVLNEVDVIVEKKKPILPVFIEDFELNDDFRYYLGRKQWIVAYPEKFEDYLYNILLFVQELLPTKNKVETEPFSAEEAIQKTKTIFDYVPERGIMINPEDHQRNVSFRTDTLINMMGGIFEDVAKLVSHEVAEKIFFDSGYISGKKFADRINNQWDTGYTFEDLKGKLDKWCHFDSAVGWGRFDVEIDIDSETENLTGTLTINEAMLVDKSQKRRVCAFVKGYCTGVMETLLGFLDIELVCKECPLKSKFKSHCVFEINVKN